MKKIYDKATKKACVYEKVRGGSITLTALNTLLEEIKKDFPLEKNIQVNYFDPPQFSFSGFGVSIISKNRHPKYTEIDTWFD